MVWWRLASRQQSGLQTCLATWGVHSQHRVVLIVTLFPPFSLFPFLPLSHARTHARTHAHTHTHRAPNWDFLVSQLLIIHKYAHPQCVENRASIGLLLHFNRSTFILTCEDITPSALGRLGIEINTAADFCLADSRQRQALAQRLQQKQDILNPLQRSWHANLLVEARVWRLGGRKWGLVEGRRGREWGRGRGAGVKMGEVAFLHTTKRNVPALLWNSLPQRKSEKASRLSRQQKL